MITGSTLRNDSSTRRRWTSIPCWRRAPCTNLNPILGVTCKISLTILSRELLSISVNVWLVKPSSCLRLRKVLSETFRFLAMVAQWNTEYFQKTLSFWNMKPWAKTQHPLRRLTVECCSSSSSCKPKSDKSSQRCLCWLTICKRASRSDSSWTDRKGNPQPWRQNV